MRGTARKGACARPQGSAPGGVGCQHQFELHVLFGPQRLDRVAKHVDQLMERSALGGDTRVLQQAPSVPFVRSVDGHVQRPHDTRPRPVNLPLIL